MNGLSLSAVRRSIGLVQQDPFIFVGTLAENLRLGATASTMGGCGRR
jgi:ABC-type multidrug transport system fused ATPase/permease subunit